MWAKSWPYDAECEQWLPLWLHLQDSAEVAGLIWDEWLAPSVKRAISAGLPEGEADGRRLLVWLAGVHDVGKASPAFAVQGRRLCDRMQSGGGFRSQPSVHQDRSSLRHEVVGAAALDEWLEPMVAGPFAEFRRAQFVAPVLGHHGAFHGRDRLSLAGRRPDLAGEGVWHETRTRLLDRAADRAGVADRVGAWSMAGLSAAAQVELTGVLIMADWIASNDEYFPLLPVDAVPEVEESGPEPSRRALEGWRRVSLGTGWTPVMPSADVDAAFRERFAWAEHGPRPEQRAVIEAAAAMTAPGMLVVEAPMGIGKTEAGLLAAEVLAARSQAGGLMVALPTQATSNAMFSRVLAWLRALPTGSGAADVPLTLLHGKAALNEEFRALPRSRVVQYDLEPVERERGEAPRLRAFVHEWFRGRKRAALAPFTVGTIDQVLFAALRAPHVMLRQLALAGKVVLVDEVHAADVYMSVFLDRAIEWLGASGASVIVMSATLPSSRRTELMAAYERGRRRSGSADAIASEADWQKRADAVLHGDIGYPVVCATAADGPQVHAVPSSPRSIEVDLRRLDDDLDTLVALLSEQLADGGCAVVVRNTVGRAQHTATVLAAAFPGEVTVAHARFIAADRADRDAELLGRFGPPGPGTVRPHRWIVVATQVVEQSLDVDFDLMVTDLAPVDLVLQRLGRLHRHQRGANQCDRPERLRRARAWVTGVEDWSAPVPEPEGGSSKVYGGWLLLAAAAVLAPHLDGEAIRLPQDIAPVVQEAYGEALAFPAAWQEAADRARAADRVTRGRRSGNADKVAIPPVPTSGTGVLGLNVAGTDVHEDSPKGQQAVRDGADSIEVVVVQSDGLQDRVPDWLPDRVRGGGESLPLRDFPVPWDQARTLAMCTLRLPAALCAPKHIDAVIADLAQQYFPGWQESPFLSGQLALVLDGDRRADVAGFRLSYDLDLGLRYERIGEPA